MVCATILDKIFGIRVNRTAIKAGIAGKIDVRQANRRICTVIELNGTSLLIGESLTRRGD
ncbi:MAG: hypothetical protein ACLS58_07315 [Sutterella wadsworthensis]